MSLRPHPFWFPSTEHEATAHTRPDQTITRPDLKTQDTRSSQDHNTRPDHCKTRPSQDHNTKHTTQENNTRPDHTTRLDHHKTTPDHDRTPDHTINKQGSHRKPPEPHKAVSDKR
ncbi:hypothetical protein E2C01_096933 [Portunus trituberculatus]|uniref:Uncharacterized protein n=1 Tax=Portunus trituberculatus TaxID=210409 RepID=A0A5B7K4E4_PORTR|nr:hypothetical protein [Portunus trituberculatus]